MHAIGLYFAVVGGTTALLKTGRGLLRGISRLSAGDVRGAAVQVASGLLAPVAAGYAELRQFGDEVGQAINGLISDDQVATEAPASATLAKVAKRGRQNSVPTADTLPT